jgi:hypothetical protein
VFAPELQVLVSQGIHSGLKRSEEFAVSFRRISARWRWERSTASRLRGGAKAKNAVDQKLDALVMRMNLLAQGQPAPDWLLPELETARAAVDELIAEIKKQNASRKST